LRCLCLVTAAVALCASADGVLRRVAPWWGAAGLALTLPFLVLGGWGEPSRLWLTLATVGVAGWARWRWRASRAALARWRSKRHLALEEELRARRRRAEEG
jgi:hypothetical protein